MSLGKKIFYILFAVVTVVIGVLLVLWNIYRTDVLLYLAIAFFVVFTVMFISMLVVNRKTGWRGEKTLPYRLAHEALFCDLYIYKAGKKKYTLDLYPAGEPDKFLQLLKGAEREDGDAMEELGESCIGQISLTPEQLGKLRGKTVATSGIIHAALGSNPALKEFLAKNTFLFY